MANGVSVGGRRCFPSGMGLSRLCACVAGPIKYHSLGTVDISPGNQGDGPKGRGDASHLARGHLSPKPCLASLHHGMHGRGPTSGLLRQPTDRFHQQVWRVWELRHRAQDHEGVLGLEGAPRLGWPGPDISDGCPRLVDLNECNMRALEPSTSRSPYLRTNCTTYPRNTLKLSEQRAVCWGRTGRARCVFWEGRWRRGRSVRGKRGQVEAQTDMRWTPSLNHLTWGSRMQPGCS